MAASNSSTAPALPVKPHLNSMKMLLVPLVAWLMAQAPLQAQVTIANGGQSAYRIVLARDAIAAERYAAEELQRYIERMSGAKLAIALESDPAQPQEILLGDSAQVRKLDPKLDLSQLGPDGFML